MKKVAEKKKKSYNNSGIWINILGGEVSESSYLTTWVSSAIACRAENLAKGKLLLYKKDSKGDITEVRKHEFLNVIGQVNIYEQSFYEILYLISSSLDVFGKAFVYVPKSKRKKPASFILLTTSRVSVKLNQDGTGIDHYEYNQKGNVIKYNTDEIIFFKLPSLNNPFDGLPTIKSCEKVIDVDNYQQQFQIKSFQNDGRVNVVLESDQLLSEEGLERLKALLAQKTGIENSSSSLVLEEGLKYKDTKLSNRELDYVKSRVSIRDEIFSKLRVPKTLMALGETTNRATAQAEIYSFIQSVIKPFSKFIIDKFNVFIQKVWGAEYYITLEWDDYKDVSEQVQIYDMLIRNSAITESELREAFGFSTDKPKV